MSANMLTVGFWIIVICACGYALVFGGAPERRTGAILAFAALASKVMWRVGPTEAGVAIGVAMVDFATLIALVWIALFARRVWPLWMAAFQGLTASAHLVAFSRLAQPWTYVAAVSVTSYVMLPLLAFGTLLHRRRMAMFGADRSWSDFSRPLPGDVQPN